MPSLRVEYLADRLRHTPIVRAVGVAVVLLVAISTTAFADTTISASGGFNATTGYADSCDTSEWQFNITGIRGTAPTSIQVTFRNTSTSATTTQTVLRSFLNPPGSLAQYATPIVAGFVLVGATAVLPGNTTYNTFVLSHGACAPSSPPPPPPTPGSTPELGTLALFGMGILGSGSYLLARRRARR
ncbi:MAG: hypothetical protein NVSMB2_24280 [Chloroflexota bacterium]